MSGTTLAITAFGHGVAATSFLLVALAILRRRVAGTNSATLAIVVWWMGLAAYLYLQAALHLESALNGPDLSLYLWSRLLAIPFLCSAAGGLTYYVLYLVTGRAGLRWPVALLYAATSALFHVQTFFPAATSLRVTPWLIELDTPTSGLTVAIYALVGLPPILASAALLIVSRRMEGPQRYRARMVASAILAYVGSGLAAYLGSSDISKVVALNVMGLFAGLLVLLAYYPPAAIRSRVGIDDAAEQERRAAARRLRRVLFAKRGGDLV